MIIQHPLAAAELGSFKSHITYNAAPEGERPDWRVDFHYVRGYVTMSVKGNSYHYKTDIAGSGVTHSN